MKYQQRTFTLPASQNTKELDWDMIFMSGEEFEKKYGSTKEQMKVDNGASIS